MPSNVMYERARPDNQAHLDAILYCEKMGFGKGIDPVELPEVLPFIARHGVVRLQYIAENGGTPQPNGVIELLPLDVALAAWPAERERGLNPKALM